MDRLIDNLAAILGSENVLSKPDELLVYECDGLPHHKHRPRAVVFPSSTEETAAVMRELDIPYISLNPGASYRGLHDSIVNYLGNRTPQMLLSIHDENAVTIAHGYAKAAGRPMALRASKASSHASRSHLRRTPTSSGAPNNLVCPP